MARRAGRASVEVVAELSKFGAQFQRELNRALRGVDLDLSPVAAQLGDAVEQGARRAQDALGDVGDAADRAGHALEDAADTATDAFDDIDAAADAAYRKMEQDAREFADQQERYFEELDAAAEEAFESIGADGERAGDTVGDSLGDGAAKAKMSLADLRAAAFRDLRAVETQVDAVEKEVRQLATEFARTGDVDIFVKIREDRATLANLRNVRGELAAVAQEADRAANGARRFGEESRNGSSVASSALSGVVGVVTSLGSALVGLGASAPTPAGLVAIGVALLGLAAAIPVVLGLGAALSTLAGLVVTLPAGVGLLAAALIPLKVAFSGVGEAIEAVIDGDPKKITEALKGLSPAARSVVREFQSLLPTLRAVRRETQEAFFRPLKGVLTEVSSALLPTVREGFKNVAREAGEFVREIAGVLTTPKAIKFIGDAFDTVARILDKSAGGGKAFVNILLTLGQKGLPIIEDLALFLLDAVERLGDFVGKAEETGKLDEFVSKAVATFRDLVDLVKSLGNFLSALFSRGEEEGGSFIRSLTDGFNAMAEALRSPEGQEFLQNLIDLLPQIIAHVGRALTVLAAIGVAINAYVGFLKTMIGFWQQVGSVVATAASAIGNAFATAGKAVADFFVGVGRFFAAIPGHVASFVSAVGSGIAGAFTTALEAVGGFFTAVGQFFLNLPGQVLDLLIAFGAALVSGIGAAFMLALESLGIWIGLILFSIFVLPGMIIDGLQALPGLLAAFFSAAWNTVVTITTTAFNNVVAFATSLPGRVVAGLTALYGLVTGLFARTWDWVRNSTVTAFNNVVAFATSLPGRISSGLASLYGVITGAFSRALSAGRSIVVNGFNSIVSWVAGVPGRLASLGGRFLSAGKSVMQGFFNGLKQAGGFAGDVGAAVVSAIKRGLNAAISSINSGISRIDNVLPGSLPRIPQLAAGGMTLAPTLAALSETGRREVVVPVDDPRTIAALRDALGIGANNGPSIVFEQGAINITFSGITPTQAEALQTGQAVAQGIAATLARSDVTTQIRTI